MKLTQAIRFLKRTYQDEAVKELLRLVRHGHTVADSFNAVNKA